jgi:hypothetical protein
MVLAESVDPDRATARDESPAAASPIKKRLVTDLGIFSGKLA